STCLRHAMAAASRFRWALPAVSCSSPSWPASFNSGCLEQLGQFLARIEQARLHCVFRNTDDLRDFFHRFLVVVDEIDDLPMVCRKCGQALAQRCTGILLLGRYFGIIGTILNRVGGLIV